MINKKQQLLLDSIGKKRHLETLKRKNRKYNPLLPKVLHKWDGDGVLFIKIPKYFNIYDMDESYIQSIQIIETLENTATNSDIHKIILDFSMTKTLKAATMVILFATVETLITKYQKSVKLIQKGVPNFVSKMISESGIDKLCHNQVPINCFSEHFLPIISGTGGNYREQIVDFIMQRIYNNQMTPTLENKYSSAIQEAILNVSAHAYTEQEEKQWWVKCSYIRKTGQLFLVIYDRGIVIPCSYDPDEYVIDSLDFSNEDIQKLLDILKVDSDHNITIEQAKELLKNTDLNNPLSDQAIIYSSMITGITRRTGKEEQKHGQGSKSIKELVKSNEQGILWIYSNKGLVKYGNSSSTPPTIYELPRPIKGTLIQWNIKVTV